MAILSAMAVSEKAPGSWVQGCAPAGAALEKERPRTAVRTGAGLIYTPSYRPGRAERS